MKDVNRMEKRVEMERERERQGKQRTLAMGWRSKENENKSIEDMTEVHTKGYMELK